MTYEATPFPAAVDPGPVLGFGTHEDPLPMLVGAQTTSTASDLPYFFHVPKGENLCMIGRKRGIRRLNERTNEPTNQRSTERMMHICC